VDPHRGGYQGEPEQHWFGGEQQHGYPYQEPGAHARMDPHVDEAYRGRRSVGRPNPEPQPMMGQQAGQWAVDPSPPAPEMPQRDPKPHREANTGTREQARIAGRQAGPAPTGTYRTQRPAVALLLYIGHAVLALPVLRVLATSAVGTFSVSGVISSVLVLLGLPLCAVGLYGLATGGARTTDAPSTHAWLRPPVAYLAVALVLFLAGGLAAR
jgi:hypothetical protein